VLSSDSTGYVGAVVLSGPELNDCVEVESVVGVVLNEVMVKDGGTGPPSVGWQSKSRLRCDLKRERCATR